MLDAPDVLLNGLELPRDGEAVSKKCGRHRASKNRFEIRNEPSEFIENGNHLSGVAIAVAGDCRPNDRHNRVLKNPSDFVLGSKSSSTYLETYASPAAVTVKGASWRAGVGRVRIVGFLSALREKKLVVH